MWVEASVHAHALQMRRLGERERVEGVGRGGGGGWWW